MSSPTEQTPTPSSPTPPNRSALVLGWLLTFWRRLENVAFGLVVLLIALYFVLQSAWVQNWLVSRIAQYLSDELQATVRIGHVDIAFFDNLALEQVYISDLRGDTLLYAGQLTAGLKNNVFTVFGNRLEFDEISLSNARCYLHRYAGEYDYNYEFLIDYFGGGGSKTTKTKSPFRIKVRNLRLNDVVFIRHSEVSGQKMTFHVPKAVVRIHNFDPNSKIADIESVDISGFYFDMEDYPSQKMPPRPNAVPKDTSARKNPPRPFQFYIRHFQLENGRFDLDRYFISPAKTTPDGVMDFDHLAVKGIDIQADSVQFTSQLAFEGMLRRLAATETQSGFAISHAAAQKVVVNDTITALYGALVQTPKSSLGDTIVLHYSQYADFLKFNNQVQFDIRLKEGAQLNLGDIIPFEKSLANNSFFTKNKDLRIDLSGQIKGKVNRLDGRNITARIGENTFANFDFDGEDLARGTDIIRMEFDFRRLQSDLASLKKIIPGLQLPEGFNKLGNVNFAGSYNLLFGYNHILSGDIRSDIGYGSLDMKLDLTDGEAKARYSGKLDMHNFDLRAWTGNKDFGNASFNLTIEEGSKGLRLSTMQARVNGRLDSLTYKDYTYRSVVLDGLFSQSLFKGKAGINDPNIQFTFDGEVNLKDSIPVYRFQSDIRRIDLKKLNLTREDWVVKANVSDVRLTGKNIADLAGVASVRDIHIRQGLDDRVIEHHIDSIRFESNFQTDDFRHFALRSEILTAEVDGRYNLSKAPGNLLKLLSRHYPVLAAQMHLPKDDSTEITDTYRFGIYIKNTQNLTKLIDPQLDTIANVSIGGQVNAEAGFTEMYARIPQIKYGDAELKKLVFNWRSELNTAALILSAPSIQLSAKNKVPPIRLKGNIANDALNFELLSDDPNAIVKSVLLQGALSVVDSLWQVRFNASKFQLFGFDWNIEPDNYIRFGHQYVETRNFELASGLQRIILDSHNQGKGLKLTTSNFDLQFINQILPTRGLTYSGRILDFDLIVDDIFKVENARFFLSTDTVFVNKTPYGRLDGNIELRRLTAPLEWSVTIRDDAFNLNTTGAWHWNGDSAQYSIYAPKVLQPADLFTQITGNQFPMHILQQFVPGISKTEGKVDINAVLNGSIKGKSPEIGLDGRVLIREGSFVIDYLNTSFYLKNQRVILTDDRIWADGAPHPNGQRYDTVYDATRKNMALVRGGLRHDLFKKWRIDCEINSIGNNFVLLDTKKSNNPVYYGKGVGNFTAQFGGTFERTDIKINATTGANTRLSIPLTDESEAREINFINFTPKTPIPLNPTPQTPAKKKRNPAESSGLNIEMNLTLTEQAEVLLIFDEKAGDILSGKGVGDISMLITRDGDFKMYGNYTIRRGEYLFTLLNFVNKPFTVSNGGSIAWYGDPYGAQININATYSETAPLYNLIRNELAIVGSNANLIAEANKSTPVSVNMLLTGELFKPSIAFGLAFPNVSPQLKSFADNKLRLLSQDPNEINRQVFGLILFGSFLPPDQFTPQTAGEYVSTLTQFVSSQLSRYLTGIVSEYFGGSVSSIDFDIIYKDNSVDLASTNALTSGRDLQFRLRSGFANDRITIQVGSQFGIARPGVNVQDGFIGEDVVIEIQPVANKQWRVKVYQRSEPDLAGGGFRNRFGVGLTFSRDFESFGEMRSGISNWIAKNKKR